MVCWDFSTTSQDQPSYGADVLRLWVSSVDYTTDVLIGPQILRQMSDIYRKLRGTLRYLLANLHDWKVCASVSSSVFGFEWVIFIAFDAPFSIPFYCSLRMPLHTVIFPRSTNTHFSNLKIPWETSKIAMTITSSLRYTRYDEYLGCFTTCMWMDSDFNGLICSNLALILFQTIQNFAIIDLSSFYFDVAKDRLYVGYFSFTSSPF